MSNQPNFMEVFMLMLSEMFALPQQPTAYFIFADSDAPSLESTCITDVGKPMYESKCFVFQRFVSSYVLLFNEI